MFTEFAHYFAPPPTLIPSDADTTEIMNSYVQILKQVTRIACWRQGNLPFSIHFSNCTKQYQGAQSTLKILYRGIKLLPLRTDPFDYISDVAADSFFYSLSWVELTNQMKATDRHSFEGMCAAALSHRRNLLRHRPCKRCRRYKPYDQSLCKPYSKPVPDVLELDLQKFRRTLKFELTNIPIRRDQRVRNFFDNLHMRAISQRPAKNQVKRKRNPQY